MRRLTAPCGRGSVMGIVLLTVGLIGCTREPQLDSFGPVSPFTLTDQTGGSFASADKLAGQVWVADFMFTTCPGPCPRMSGQMHQVQMALEGQGIKLVSFTVDPQHDTPEVLTEYGKQFKASPGVWSFLTGAQADLNHLSKDVFKLSFVDGSLEHSTRFVLVDQKSQIRGYYLTSEPDAIQNLIRDAQGLLKAKS
ncbi:MAG: SCO family protein [Acidobacteriota bacterium]